MSESEAQRRVSLADPKLGRLEKRCVEDVIDSGIIASGEEVQAFQSEFAEYCAVDHAVATANGTAALHAALEAVGIGSDDRVITTPFSFVATANAVRLRDAEPVFADIDPETYNLDPHAVEAVARDDPDVEAILAVDLYGLPAAMDPLRDIAETYDLALVEDAAQAHGAIYDGKRAGSLGDVACFSFYPTKNMTTGEGGMITTDREDVADRVSEYINHGRPTDGDAAYEHVRVGHNYRMTDIAAAIGRVQLKRLEPMVDARRDNADRLTECIRAVPGVEPPSEPPECRHAYHQYTVRCDERESLAAHLDVEGVDTGVYYPTPIHEQPPYRAFERSLQVAETAADEVLSLPVHPNLEEADLLTIERALERYEP